MVNRQPSGERARPSAGYVHDALFYDTDAELVATAAPFLRDALAAGERAVIACAESRAALLTEAVGDDPRVSLLPYQEVFRRTPGAIAYYQAMMERELAAGTTRVRLIGEVDFGAGPAQWREWIRFEAACNHALASYPLWSVCLYDRRRLSDEVLSSGSLTHPFLHRDGAQEENGEYQQPDAYLRSSVELGPDPIEATGQKLRVDNATDVASLRRILTVALQGECDLPRMTMDGFVVSVSEVVTNALKYGHPPVSVQLFATRTRALCVVTDRGTGFDNPFAGYLRPVDIEAGEGGLGLWLTRQLCDQVDIALAPEGFTVRLAVGS